VEEGEGVSQQARERLRKWCEARYVSRDARGESGIIQLTAADLREAMVVALECVLTDTWEKWGPMDTVAASDIRALIAAMKGSE